MEREIFEQAVREHQDMVFRVALHCFANRQDAEDTVQEVFLRLYGRQEPFESPEHLRRWLIRVTVNCCRDVLRSPWRKRRIYQATFAQVHSSAEIRWEEMEMKARRQRPLGRRMLVLAAVMGLIAVLSATAVAADWFGLRQLLLPGGREDPQAPMSIGLAGYVQSPESQALARWRSRLEEKWIDSGGAVHTEEPSDRLSLCQVYTEEMEQELRQIAEEYDLKLHTSMADSVRSPELLELCGAFGAPDHHVTRACLYEDGTLFFDGDGEVEGFGTVFYQFTRCVKGSFTDAMLTIGNVKDYTEWTYGTADKTAVTLALGPEKALILADLGDSMVTVNVLTGGGQDLAPEDLEALADSFAFSHLTPAQAPEELPLETEDPLYFTTGLSTARAMEFVRELAELMENGDRQALAELLRYPCQVNVEQGTFSVETPEEFLDFYDQVVEGQRRELVSQLMQGSLLGRNGLVGVGDGDVWFGLTEDGTIRLFTLQTPNGWSVRPEQTGVTAS